MEKGNIPKQSDAVATESEYSVPWVRVQPVMLECAAGDLCRRPYAGHPKGCPNHGKRSTCPPQARRFGPAEFEPPARWYAIWNVFPFGEHVERMRMKHPDWSRRQLECCLYWQGGARKQLEQELERFRRSRKALGFGVRGIYRIPEAHGVDVTATMRRVGIELEWPPRTVAYQVALALVRQDLDDAQPCDEV